MNCAIRLEFKVKEYKYKIIKYVQITWIPAYFNVTFIIIFITENLIALIYEYIIQYNNIIEL